MKGVIVFVAVALMAMPAMADLVETTATPFDGEVASFGAESGRTQVVYDNTANSSGSYHNAAGLEEGDDLAMTGGGILDHFEFGYYDPVGDGAVAYMADVLMYDMATFVGDGTDMPLIMYTVGLPGEGAWIVAVDEADPSVTLPANIVMSVWFDNAVDCGLMIYDPPVVGASTDAFWKNDGTGNWYWFGGPPNPVANFCLEVEIVPEPASLLLLAIGGLLIRRR